MEVALIFLCLLYVNILQGGLVNRRNAERYNEDDQKRLNLKEEKVAALLNDIYKQVSTVKHADATDNQEERIWKNVAEGVKDKSQDEGEFLNFNQLENVLDKLVNKMEGGDKKIKPPGGLGATQMLGGSPHVSETQHNDHPELTDKNGNKKFITFEEFEKKFYEIFLKSKNEENALKKGKGVKNEKQSVKKSLTDVYKELKDELDKQKQDVPKQEKAKQKQPKRNFKVLKDEIDFQIKKETKLDSKMKGVVKELNELLKGKGKVERKDPKNLIKEDEKDFKNLLENVNNIPKRSSPHSINNIEHGTDNNKLTKKEELRSLLVNFVNVLDENKKKSLKSVNKIAALDKSDTSNNILSKRTKSTDKVKENNEKLISVLLRLKDELQPVDTQTKASHETYHSDEPKAIIDNNGEDAKTKKLRELLAGFTSLLGKSNTVGNKDTVKKQMKENELRRDVGAKERLIKDTEVKKDNKKVKNSEAELWEALKGFDINKNTN